MMKRRSRGWGCAATLLAVLAVGAMVACEDDPIVANDVITGGYFMVSVNGTGLPVSGVMGLGVPETLNCDDQVAGGELTLRPDLSFRLVIDTRTLCPSFLALGSITLTGNYSIDGDEILYLPAELPIIIRGVLGADTATVELRDRDLVFKFFQATER